MFTNTVIADEHRRDLLALAQASRKARTARQGRPAGSRLPRMRSILRLTGTAAAAGAAAAALILGQAGTAAQASVTPTLQTAYLHSPASPQGILPCALCQK